MSKKTRRYVSFAYLRVACYGMIHERRSLLVLSALIAGLVDVHDVVTQLLALRDVVNVVNTELIRIFAGIVRRPPTVL